MNAEKEVVKQRPVKPRKPREPVAEKVVPRTMGCVADRYSIMQRQKLLAMSILRQSKL